MRKLPAKYAAVLVPLVLTGVMTCIVSGIATVRALGPGLEMLRPWLEAWLISWATAFPLMTVLLPVVRRLVMRFVSET